mmetsp:Transcript_16780/g.43093  ORF Transcript_16780/g.43093 Transcript_16780/m.43093 type:complete len:240 (+) Transcript_16780:162-881(+)
MGCGCRGCMLLSLIHRRYADEVPALWRQQLSLLGLHPRSHCHALCSDCRPILIRFQQRRTIVGRFNCVAKPRGLPLLKVSVHVKHAPRLGRYIVVRIVVVPLSHVLRIVEGNRRVGADEKQVGGLVAGVDVGVLGEASDVRKDGTHCIGSAYRECGMQPIAERYQVDRERPVGHEPSSPDPLDKRQQQRAAVVAAAPEVGQDYMVGWDAGSESTLDDVDRVSLLHRSTAALLALLVIAE